jgi:hypothetical protein
MRLKWGVHYDEWARLIQVIEGYERALGEIVERRNLECGCDAVAERALKEGQGG